jgi:hypothetical protein
MWVSCLSLGYLLPLFWNRQHFKRGSERGNFLTIAIFCDTPCGKSGIFLDILVTNLWDGKINNFPGDIAARGALTVPDLLPRATRDGTRWHLPYGCWEICTEIWRIFFVRCNYVERLLNFFSELSVRLYPWSNSRPVGRILMKFRQ